MTFAAGSALAATNHGTMDFGMGSGNIPAQADAGVKPDYSTFWVGPWTLDSGWAGPNDWFERTQSQGVTPAVHLYYWGDDISPSCIEDGCWSDLHNSHKSKAEWQKLTQQLVDNLWKTMDGDPVMVFLETEFNQNGAGTYEELDRLLTEKVHFIKNNYPAAEVVVPFGNWRSWDWHTFDRAASAADYVGLQGMRGSTQDSWDSYHSLYESTRDGVQKLESLFGQEIILQDIALSSYPDWEYKEAQANELREFFDGMGELKAAGVEAMIYRSWFNSNYADTNNYYGEAERHWGLVYADSHDWKPAANAWVNGVQAERGGSTQDTSSTSGDYAASFSPKSQDNEWWIETDVEPGAAQVEARIDGGGWFHLDKKSWGSWATSKHVPNGAHVDFRATSSSGQTATSQTYVWGDGNQDTSAFTADFEPKSQGNEWWVEVGVNANQDLSKVEARVDGGQWRTLDHKHWGAWGDSFHVPSGATVDFRATAADGQTATSDGFVWNEGGGTTSVFDANFAPKSQGNEWWVEVGVDANKDLSKVEARVDGGHWRTLDHKHWGAWAKSFHVPDGATVDFRATAADGQTAYSDGYRWSDGGGTATVFEADFSPKSQGNEWWVEVDVDGTQDISKVEARVDGGHWRTLDHKEWGSWAKSFKVDGSEVQFRATAQDGQTATSSAYGW